MANTTTCPYPSNINGLSPIGFQFSISKLPGVSFFSQSVTLPGMSLPSPEQGTPLSISYLSGDKVEFEELSVRFIVDENMDNYITLHNWIVGLSKPESFEQYVDFINDEDKPGQSELAKHYSDGVLTVLNSSNKPNKIIRFVDLVPTSIQTLEFGTTLNDVQYLTASATFRYSYYFFD